ncbi:MAG: hypothetical protein ACTSUE_15485 [Promethearchaeota archaeon]
MAANDYYEGYRCLFDHDYVPKDVIGRRKEIEFLDGFLIDNISLRQGTSGVGNDRYGSAILLDGLRGVGKATLAKKVIENLSISKETREIKIKPVVINCWEKDEAQLLADFMVKLGVSPPISTPVSTGFSPRFPVSGPVNPAPVNPGLRDTWNVIYTYLRKQINSTCFTMLFKNSDFIPIRFFKKLLVNLKGMGINIIFTSRISNNYQFLEHVDVNLNLEVYTLGDLNAIVEDRYQTAFSSCETVVPRFITDAVVEFDTSRPGPCITVLKHVYPELKGMGNAQISLELVQHCIKNNLSNLSYSEFEVVDFLNTAPIQLLILLDNIASYFKNSTRGEYYISRQELRELYDISCESMMMRPSEREFDEYMVELLQFHVLLKSNNYEEKYFSLIPSNLIQSFLDEVIGQKKIYD